MDPRIRQLRSTPCGGQCLARRQIADIQQAGASCARLSRSARGHTVCLQLRWQTAPVRHRLQQALGLLEQRAGRGRLTLSARQRRGPGSAPQEALSGPRGGETAGRSQAGSAKAQPPQTVSVCPLPQDWRRDWRR